MRSTAASVTAYHLLYPSENSLVGRSYSRSAIVRGAGITENLMQPRKKRGRLQTDSPIPPNTRED